MPGLTADLDAEPFSRGGRAERIVRMRRQADYQPGRAVMSDRSIRMAPPLNNAEPWNASRRVEMSFMFRTHVDEIGPSSVGRHVRRSRSSRKTKRPGTA